MCHLISIFNVLNVNSALHCMRNRSNSIFNTASYRIRNHIHYISITHHMVFTTNTDICCKCKLIIIQAHIKRN